MNSQEHPAAIERWDADGVSLLVAVERPAQEVWAALADPAARDAWWRPGIVLEARPGGRFEEPWTNMAGELELTRGQVLAAVAPMILQFTWGESDWPAETTVEISLEADRAGCVLYLSHEGFLPITEALGEEVLGAHVIAWRRQLKRLKAWVERKELPSDDDTED